ncbi:unnamed protein product [Merluccius merluccius]
MGPLVLEALRLPPFEPLEQSGLKWWGCFSSGDGISEACRGPGPPGVVASRDWNHANAYTTPNHGSGWCRH